MNIQSGPTRTAFERVAVATSVTLVLTLAFVLSSSAVAWAAPGHLPRGVALPLPEAAGPVPNAVGNDIFCSSATACTAVGEYQDTIGITHGMVENLASGTWTAGPILAPTNAPDYTFADLNAVSCISSGNCIAVGDYRISTVQTESFYSVETSGVWARGIELPVPPDAESSPAETSFSSVSCMTDGRCDLLGIYAVAEGKISAIHAVIDEYKFGTGIVGSPAELSQLASQQGIDLNSISCTQEGSGGPYCMAVGAQVGANSEEATYVRETDGVWGNPVLLKNPAGSSIPQEFLSSVSCVSTGNCVAAGNYLNGSSQEFAEVYREQAGEWGHPAGIGEPHNYSNPFVDDVSCVSIDTCTLVGAISDMHGSLHAATAESEGGRWGQFAPAANPLGGVPDEEFLGVSCTTGVTCSAVGYFNVTGAGGGTNAMGTTWVPANSPGPVTALRISHVSSTSASLAWDPPVNIGSGISHYELTTDPGPKAVDSGPAYSTSGTVNRLSPGDSYRLSVQAVATDGQTSPSVAVTVRIPAVRPTTPAVIRVGAIVHGLYVAWRAPKSTGGAPITSYRVKASCAGVVHAARFSGNARHGTFHGLPSGVRCSVRVAAVNRAGTSPFSPARSGVTR